MKFHFERIGPIDAADLELGDLTIIAGRNNTGKTYLVYTMYGFLRTLASSWRRPLRDSLLGQFGEFLSSEVGGRLKVDRYQIGLLRRRNIENAGLSGNSISQIFSAPPTAFADAHLSVELSPDLPSDGMRFYFSADESRVIAEYHEKAIDLTLISRASDASRHRAAAVALEVNAALPDVPKPFMLSAERFGIALFYRELDFTKSRLVEMLQLIDDQQFPPSRSPLLVVDRVASRYSMPVKDNVDFARGTENVLHRESDFFDDKLHDQIKDLMSGYYTNADGVIRFKSKARKRRAFDIPLHIASSSARGLSDLYFYLRHVASRNDILFIDEPETHLDTANQIQFAHVISRLVAAGLKVLLSTHSDYLIKEINNLVMLDHLQRNGDCPNRKKLNYGAGEGISCDRIRAYIAEKNTLTRCAVDRYGIDAPVFDQTIDKINRVSTELAAAVADTE